MTRMGRHDGLRSAGTLRRYDQSSLPNSATSPGDIVNILLRTPQQDNQDSLTFHNRSDDSQDTSSPFRHTHAQRHWHDTSDRGIADACPPKGSGFDHVSGSYRVQAMSSWHGMTGSLCQAHSGEHQYDRLCSSCSSLRTSVPNDRIHTVWSHVCRSKEIPLTHV